MVRLSAPKSTTSIRQYNSTLSPDLLKLFAKVTHSVASELDLEKTLYGVVDEIFDYFKPRGASIMIKDGNMIEVVAGQSITQKQGKGNRPTDLPKFKLGEGVAGRAALLGRPVFVEDTLDDPKFHQIPGKISKIRSIIAVPMKIRGRVTGVINVAFSEPRHFSTEDINLLEVIAAPAAYAIQNASLFEKISEERSKLELIQNSMRDGLTVSDTTGKFLFMNSAVREMLGFVELYSAKNIEASISNISKISRYKVIISGSLEPELVNVVQLGKTFKTTLTIQGETKKSIEATFSPLKNTSGLTIGVLGLFHDISESLEQARKIEEQLLTTETERRRWEALFDNVEESILILNPKGVIVRANPSTESITGLTIKEIVGQNFDKIMPIKNERGVSLSGELSPLITLQATKEPIDYMEARFTNAEDREIWIGLSLTPIKSDGSAENQIIVVVRDISKLKEIDQAKSDFVSMASHELRTPLTVINGYIDLFMGGDLGDIDKPELTQYKKVFSQIQRSTVRLNKLVEDLLNVSRIEQGRLNLNLEKMNLSLLIEDVVAEMKEHAASRGHKLQYTPPTVTFLDLPLLINGDHGKIKQVLINLIDNAIKYTKNNGLIEVSIKRDRNEAIVSVKDNGLGIPKQLLPRIFEKFQRLEGSYVKDSVGTGLGLYIVKEILKSHGGRIWIDSQVGRGSTFSFSLPLYRD